MTTGIDQGTSLSYNSNYPVVGINQSSQQFRDNFLIIKTAVENLQNKTITFSGILSGSSSIFDSGSTAVNVNVTYTNNVIVLPNGNPTPSLGMFRFNSSTQRAELYTDTWHSVITDSVLGVNNGVATLNSSGQVNTSQLPSSLTGAVVYQGVWNANTNTPALASGVGTKGQYYKVSVAGSTTIDGINTWNVNDTIIFDGTTWDKIDGITSEVVSVFGRTGAVSLLSGDISTALGYIPYNAANPSGYITASSPVLTGIPTAPTATTGTNSTQIATTAFVTNAVTGGVGGSVTSFNSRTGAVTLTSSDVTTALGFTPYNASNPSNYVTASSPNLTGIPTAPTATAGTNTTQLATTAFVTNAVAASTTGVSSFNGRTGAVVPISGDYTVTQITGAAPLASPTFTGTVTLPDNTTWSNTGLANSASLTTSTQLINSYAPTITFNGTTSVITLAVKPTYSIQASAANHSVTGIQSIITVDSSTVNSTNLFGVTAQVSSGAGYTGTIASASAFGASAPNISGSTPFTTFNYFATVTGSTNGNGVTSGTITNNGLNVIAFTAAAASGGTVNNNGINIALGTGSGAGTTSNIGLSISGNGGSGGTGTTKNYAINSSSTAPSLFSGSVTTSNIITTSPNNLFGTTASTGIGGHALGTEIVGTSGTANNAYGRWSADINGNFFGFYKSRGAAVGAHTAAQTGDNIAIIYGAADDGSTVSTNVANITFSVGNGTISTGIVPGAITLNTANTSGVMTQALAIDSNQNVTISKKITFPDGSISSTTGTSFENVVNFTTGNPTRYTNSMDPGSSQLWYVVGRFTGSNGGMCKIKFVGGSGYNANFQQAGYDEIIIRYGNQTTGGVNVAGFYYRVGYNNLINQVKCKSVNGVINDTAYDIYIQVNSFAGDTYMTFETDISSSFAFNGTTTTDPGAASSTIAVLSSFISFQATTIGVNGTLTPASNNTINIGASGNVFANVYATTFQGTATSAQYADLAERYETDTIYSPGTVVIFGGSKEITQSTKENDTNVAGVISTNPAYMMNSTAGNNDDFPYIALVGRVPCMVVGPVEKGQLLTTSNIAGCAMATTNPVLGSIIGKSLQQLEEGQIELIEISVQRM